ncbi:MAG: ankyrin repeat domain-containing protein [Lentisphaerae bacterium]|nr:ankyrin repeat domain-containing protein [Lentisphaerota bacterium]
MKNKYHIDTYLLYIASQFGHSQLVEELSKMPDVNVNVVENTRTTPLFIACSYGHVGVVKALLGSKKIFINRANCKSQKKWINLI